MQCNGKCHLAKQLQMIEVNEDQDENSAIAILFEAFYPLYYHTQTVSDDVSVVITFPKKRWFLPSASTHTFIDELFHPPQQALS